MRRCRRLSSTPATGRVGDRAALRPALRLGRAWCWCCRRSRRRGHAQQPAATCAGRSGCAGQGRGARCHARRPRGLCAGRLCRHLGLCALPARGRSAAAGTRPLQRPTPDPCVTGDWPAIEALDAPAFGASACALLRAAGPTLAAGGACLGEAGRLRGFVFGRDGREAHPDRPLAGRRRQRGAGAAARSAAGRTGPLSMSICPTPA